jgi:DNA processing protein
MHHDEASAAALAALPKMTIHRLRVLLNGRGPVAAFAMAGGRAEPTAAVRAVLDTQQLAACWREHATDAFLAKVAKRCTEERIAVCWWDGPGYPARLVSDPLPPPVLYIRGNAVLLDQPSVAIVGTRHPTAQGAQAAHWFAQALAAAGLHIVSGLARGVDGAAHRGCLRAEAGRPIGVVGSGLDVVYPRQHRQLWEQVGEAGVLVSEAPPGGLPEAYRFPLRNRVIAGLADIVLVVESRERGGSLITVSEALRRNREVMVVPGSPASPASAGTNALLRDGASPATHPDDVLMALHLGVSAAIAAPEHRPAPFGQERAVYELCRDGAQSIEALAARLSLAVAEVAMSVARLERDGWVVGSDGWYELRGAPLDG